MTTQYIEDPQTKEQIPFEWDSPKPPSQKDIDSLFKTVRNSSQVVDKSLRTWGQVAKEGLTNIPSSLITDVATPIYQAIRHPLQTAEAAVSTVKGLGVMGTEAILGKDLPGWFMSEEDKASKRFPQAIGKDFSEAYGGIENIKNTLAEHPARVGMDVSTLASGAGSALKAGGFAKAAAIAGKVGDITNPLTVPTKLLGEARVIASKLGLPEEIYARAMKIPPGSLRQEDKAKVINTLVRNEKLPLGNSTRDKMNSIIKTVDGEIDSILQGLSAQGNEININVVSQALDNLKGKYSSYPNSQSYYNLIDHVKTEFISHPTVQGKYMAQGLYSTVPNPRVGNITLVDAQNLKKGTYAQLESFYKKGAMPETGRVGIRDMPEADAKAVAASTLRQAILDGPGVPTEVRALLSREAGLMQARKWVERAANRGGNIDIASLGSMAFGIMVEHGIPAATAYRIATFPAVQSRIALGLAHGLQSAQKVGDFIRTTSPSAFQAGRIALTE